MHVQRLKTVLSKELVHVRLRGIVCGVLVQSESIKVTPDLALVFPSPAHRLFFQRATLVYKSWLLVFK